MKEAAGATFTFLSDPEGRLLDAFDMRHTAGRMDGVDIAQSASFLLDPRGRILWQKVAENYRVRPRPSEILAAADQLLDS